MTNIDLVLTIMQIIGALYAIFFAVSLLGIQISLTILSQKDTEKSFLNAATINEFNKTLPKFKIVNHILAYFVIMVEFSCAAYVYYGSVSSFPLLILYILFVLAILYIILISNHLIDYFLSIIANEPEKLNFESFKYVGRWNFSDAVVRIVIVFITIGLYPYVHFLITNIKNGLSYPDTDSVSAIISILVGLVMHVWLFPKSNKNTKPAGSEQNIKALQPNIEKLEDDIKENEEETQSKITALKKQGEKVMGILAKIESFLNHCYKRKNNTKNS